MVKNKAQLAYALGAILLLVVLYLGFKTTTSSQRALEKSRALSPKAYDIATFRQEAVKGLTDEELLYIETLEAQLHHAGQDTVKSSLLKQLSGYWFSLQNHLMAGLYAVEVAELDNTAESWSITGTTFAAGLQRKETDARKIAFLREQAVSAFEKAISLEPDVVGHRVNQALCYVEAPEEGQPMKGIQMLMGLAETYPKDPAPLFQLARLAVQTGQYERAKARIDMALELKPGDARLICLAAEIYSALQSEEANAYSAQCAEMIKN